MAASNAQVPSGATQPGDVVDWHSHVWLPEHLGSEWGGEIDAKYPHTPSRCGSPELHNEAMRHAGITKMPSSLACAATIWDFRYLTNTSRTPCGISRGLL